jgi:cytochrome oxidase Cu insertion factor (SCO1/SenC/PrrC family)
MNKKKSLTLDIIVWIVVMVLAATVAFCLLKRDKERHFGAVSFGSFPQFKLKTVDGSDFDEHRIKAHVWAVHAASSAANAMSMAQQLTTIGEQTSSGKRHMYVLTFSGETTPILQPLTQAHRIVVGQQQQISDLFSFSGKLNDNSVFLVDQNGVIRGKYDFTDVDEFRSFRQDLMRLL